MYKSKTRYSKTIIFSFSSTNVVHKVISSVFPTGNEGIVLQYFIEILKRTHFWKIMKKCFLGIIYNLMSLKYKSSWYISIVCMHQMNMLSSVEPREFYTIICSWSTQFYHQRWHVSSRFSSNSELNRFRIIRKSWRNIPSVLYA